MSDTKRKEKDRLPKDVTKLTGDQVMQKVFNKKTVRELKKLAHESEPPETK